MQDLDGAGCDQPDEIAGRKRVVGPAVPPQELLDQAAEVAEAVSCYHLLLCIQAFRALIRL